MSNRNRTTSLAAMAVFAGAALPFDGPMAFDPARRERGSRHGSSRLDEIEGSVRDDEARKAKAEAKRQRRMERNRRMSGK